MIGHHKKIAFVSAMSGCPWGGCEVLWSETALRLAQEGHAVAASVQGWSPRPKQWSALSRAGVEIDERLFTRIRLRSRAARALFQPLLRIASQRAFTRWVARQKADLTCISSGWIIDDLGLMNLCLRSGRPYAVIVHANAEQWWPPDKHAPLLIDIYRSARRVFFVSERNRRLLETQLGIELAHAEVVRNPCNVRRNASPAWPAENGSVRLACVGRLEPEAKGQDLLLQVLASEPWCSRPVSVSFFGKGDCEEGLRRLADRLGLGERVRFCGQSDDVESIWATHHALVLPSRYEGLPLTVVEAMLCGRPVIVTNVAGNNEVVQADVTGFLAEAPTVEHLNSAMERAWNQRHQWEAMGQAAARAIRELMPADPAGDFARKLLDLAGDNRP